MTKRSDTEVTYDGIVNAFGEARLALVECNWQDLATWAHLVASYARCFRAQELARDALGEQERFQLRLPRIS